MEKRQAYRGRTDAQGGKGKTEKKKSLFLTHTHRQVGAFRHVGMKRERERDMRRIVRERKVREGVY
eukprot:1282042-Amorphochlora_amoeboformis.AAC.1